MYLDPLKLINILQNILKNGKPKAIICHTVKGQGIPMIENNISWHHKTKINEDEKVLLIESLKNA